MLEVNLVVKLATWLISRSVRRFGARGPRELSIYHCFTTSFTTSFTTNFTTEHASRRFGARGPRELSIYHCFTTSFTTSFTTNFTTEHASRRFGARGPRELSGGLRLSKASRSKASSNLVVKLVVKLGVS